MYRELHPYIHEVSADKRVASGKQMDNRHADRRQLFHTVSRLTIFKLLLSLSLAVVYGGHPYSSRVERELHWYEWIHSSSRLGIWTLLRKAA
jgi:hypothetical protein